MIQMPERFKELVIRVETEELGQKANNVQK
jgi:hypothetical protein